MQKLFHKALLESLLLLLASNLLQVLAKPFCTQHFRSGSSILIKDLVLVILVR